MKIENIRLFLAVVRTGSINKAAESLFISQQSLGVIIKGLEKELGLTLLARSRKGVRLTRQGEAFLPYAQGIVSLYDEFVQQSCSRENGIVLSLYTTPALGRHIARLQGRVFGGRYYLSVHERSMAEMSELLADRSPGLYFIPLLGGRPEELSQRPDKQLIARDDTYVTICHASSPLLKPGVDLAQELARQTVLFDTYEAGEVMDKAINIKDITVCKKLMIERGFVYITTYRLYCIDFAEEQWVIINQNQGDAVEYVLFGSSGSTPELRQAKAELVQSLRDIFSKSA